MGEKKMKVITMNDKIATPYGSKRESGEGAEELSAFTLFVVPVVAFVLDMRLCFG
jgi:hypothetical protein